MNERSPRVDRVLALLLGTLVLTIYHWPDLGSPAVPETMPAIHTPVGVPDFK
ncbi:MAG TPA: hypothetical protein VJZ25_00760 [Gemmatimonadaceae bacterium]|nr:hypothetical protein [Gemmatimonadaceae bacterium]